MADIAVLIPTDDPQHDFYTNQYHEIKDRLCSIACDEDLKHVKTVYKRLMYEKNDQSIKHIAETAENVNNDLNFVFCWQKQLRKLAKLRDQKIKHLGDNLLEQIGNLIDPDVMEDEMLIDSIEDSILSYVIANQKFDRIVLGKKSRMLIIKTVGNKNKPNDEDYNDSDASFESDDARNRYANMNIAEALEDVLDNEVRTDPDPIQGLDLVKYDPESNTYFFLLTPPSYIGNSRITVLRINVNESLCKNNFEIVTAEYEFSTSHLKENTQYDITVELENDAGFKSNQNPTYKIYTHRSSNDKKQIYITTHNNNSELPEEGAFKCEQKSYITTAIQFASQIPLKIIDLDVGGNSLCLLNTGGVLNWGKIIANKDENVPSSLLIIDFTSVTERVVGIYIPISGCLIREISCGKNFCLALSCTGQIYSWGFNSYGQLGHNDFYHRPDPTKIKSDRFFTSIKAAYENCYAEDDKNVSYVWGKNMSLKFLLNRGKVSIMNNPEDRQNSPRKLDFDSTVKMQRVEIGSSLYVFLTQNHKLYTLGDNTYGQLGFDRPDGTELPFCDQPHKLDINNNIVDFSVGKYHVLYIDDHNCIYGFGRNTEHQIKKTNIPYYRSAVCTRENADDVQSVLAFNKTSLLRFKNGTYCYLSENRKCEYAMGQVIHKSYNENLVSIH